jgi:hypothetical protein
MAGHEFTKMRDELRSPRLSGAPGATPTCWDRLYEPSAMKGRTVMKLPTLREAIVWAFIALVALFFTHPTAEQHSVFDEPLALPAELEPLLPAQ